MNMSTAAVYLSCRRSVSTSLALALTNALRARGCDVFFAPTLNEADEAARLAEIEARPHFLLLLTPGQIEAYQRPNDPVFHELQYARDKRRNIVPLLTNNFKFSTTNTPDEIAFLRHYRALSLQFEALGAAVTALLDDYLTQQIFGQITPPPPELAARARLLLDETLSRPIPGENHLRAEAIFNHAFSRSRQDLASRLADYDAALRLNPEHIHARFNRALARRRGGDEMGALEDYDEVLRLRPDYYRAYNNRGELHFSFGDYEQALKDFEQANALCPNFTMALAGEALTLHALGRINAALDLWKPLAESDQRFYDAAWVGRELRLPAAMIDEIHHLTARLPTPNRTPNP